MCVRVGRSSLHHTNTLHARICCLSPQFNCNVKIYKAWPCAPAVSSPHTHSPESQSGAPTALHVLRARASARRGKRAQSKERRAAARGSEPLSVCPSVSLTVSVGERVRVRVEEREGERGGEADPPTVCNKTRRERSCAAKGSEKKGRRDQ